jgi:long-chain fatty acid transport protein
MKMNRTRVISFSAMLGMALLNTVGDAAAAGFALLEQSAEGTGFAYAGSSTGYDDGSATFFNPAAMSAMDGGRISGSFHVIDTSAEFNNQGSTVGPFPSLGGDGPDGGQVGLVPNLYAMKNFGKFAAGFAVTTPFGLGTEYDSNYVGRYQGVKSELSAVNASGSFSYSILDNFSVGANLGVFRTDAEITSAVDFGSIGFGVLGAPTATALGLAPQRNDGFVKFEGDDWSLGWGLGTLYTYGEENENRIGLSYRAKSNVELNGEADFTVPGNAQVLTSRGAFTDSDITARTTLPESLTFGTKHWVDPKWAVLYESAWTRWSRFEELRIEYANPAQPDSVTPENWKNSWRHSLGFEHKPCDAWRLRSGFTYDRSVIKDSSFRTPRIPDSDRYWLALGGSYIINPDLTWNLSYAHLFISDAESNTTGPTGDVLRGEWNADANIVSTSLTYALN